MRSPSHETESGVQRYQKGIRGFLKSLAGFIKRLAAFIQLTEAEQEEAGIHIERKGDQ